MSTAPSPAPTPSMVTSVIDRYWEIWGEVLGLIGSWANMLFDVLVWIVRSLIQRRARFGAQALAVQVVRVGTRSIGIVLLVSGCIGIILALQTAPSLREFGQVDKVANLVGVAVFRELGPLIAAIVLTGFAGASIAAELGTMKVGEEIEALEAMALNPIRFLVMPRVIATAGSLIVLSVFADICSVVSVTNDVGKSLVNSKHQQTTRFLGKSNDFGQSLDS